MATRTFAVGDKVTWMKTTFKGGGISFSSRDGVVVTLGNSRATVRGDNGRKQWIRYDDLRHANEKNEVTEVFEAIAGAQTPSTFNPQPSTGEEAAQ